MKDEKKKEQQKTIPWVDEELISTPLGRFMYTVHDPDVRLKDWVVHLPDGLNLRISELEKLVGMYGGMEYYPIAKPRFPRYTPRSVSKNWEKILRC